VVAALELYLDPDASRRVRTLWAALEADGVPTVATLMDGLHRPHVSLAVADQLEPQAVAEALDGLSAVPPVRLAFHFAGQFLGRVLWLGPAPSASLLTHQSTVYERLSAAGVEVSDHYRPQRWVPHTTLAMRVPNALMGNAIRRCLEVVPIEATLVRAAIADHSVGLRHMLT
jgi:2'-5' RNA ligase